MIWQRSVVAKEKVRTIEVKDETYPDGHWGLVGPTTIDLTDMPLRKR